MPFGAQFFNIRLPIHKRIALLLETKAAMKTQVHEFAGIDPERLLCLLAGQPVLGCVGLVHPHDSDEAAACFNTSTTWARNSLSTKGTCPKISSGAPSSFAAR